MEYPECLEYPEYQKENKKQIEDEVTDHKFHSHIQMNNSHWQLRLSHCSSHTAFILTPLPIPNNIEVANVK